MSFDYPQEPRRRRKGGFSGIMMLMIIVFGLYFFMSSRGGGGAPDEGNRNAEQGQRSVENRSGGGKLDSYTNRELQEIDKDRRLQETVFGKDKAGDSKNMPTGRGNSNGDWSMEGVAGNKGSTPSSSNKTEGKDGWSLEGMPAKQKSGTGLELNNSGGSDVKITEKSDWSVEGVKPKIKKTTKGDWSVGEVEGGGN